MLRVLLTGGGTGGHVNPAIAIADTVRRNQPDAEILFVGVKGGKESDLVPRAGYRLEYVDIQGFQRSLSPKNIRAVYLALTSPYSPKTRRILTEFRPDVVIGTGGYVCWPMLCAAARAGIPTLLHESNCLPGLAVRRLQKRVDRILLNFPETAQQLKPGIAEEKCITVGNPLRGGFDDIDCAGARRTLGLGQNEKMVLAYAGSLGSSSVNRAVIETLAALAPDCPATRFILATGVKNYDEARELCRVTGVENCANVSVEKYIYDMPVYMAAADVVISRAGAVSLTELARMGKATIVIPSPYVADNHQLKNASAMADRGAAVLVEEKDFPAGALTLALRELLEDGTKRAKLSDAIGAFAGRDANRLIYEQILLAAEQSRKR